MKKIFSLLALVTMAVSLFGAHVPQSEAKTIALRFYADFTGQPNPAVANVAISQHQSTTTFYTFNFNNGFVIVAADDASIPILAYSNEGAMPDIIANPATQNWLDGYSSEIYQIIHAGLSNNATKPLWDELKNGRFKASSSTQDVNPLLTTTWDQGCFYNALCPADPAAGWSCGHVYTGCVATAMAQVMKYHNYPPQGVGSHSYTHPDYGVQTANFGATTYNWSAMPNNVTSSNTSVATLMYHAGVSVDMQYGVDGSGAFSDDVPYAMINYFNYLPEAEIKYKSNYPNLSDWENLLRADLDEQLPVYYSGYGSGGHAFVCDGYRMSDSKFHFNWGWSGSSNGWYAIGALNPGGSNFNQDNAAVVHVKPGNPNLIVRITHPVNNAIIGAGYPVEIEAVAVRGVPLLMKIFIDNNEVLSTSNDTIAFTWNTTTGDLGGHEVKAYAYSATDTGYYKINLNVAEWISQASGFPTVNRGISYMSAVDSNIVWAAGFDNNTPTNPCSDFTRTLDGGNTWTPGVITNTTGLACAMIFAMDAEKAYVPMYKVNGLKAQGIYYTSDGGATWSRQTSASFSNSASFPNCIHFFNDTDGWCMGDPINGHYEIYTTTDGGTTWTAVSATNIPNPATGEFGVVGYYSAVNDTLWFGTNKGRVYRSTDKGYTWSVSTVAAFNGKYIKPTFRTGLHGLVQDKDAGTTGAICETFDGGLTWTPVVATGPIYATDIQYVPGTENTWVSSGSAGSLGASYSFNGGHTWSDFIGTSGAAYMQMTWLNNHCGFAGGANTNTTENGAYKFIGVLMPALPAPGNLHAVVTGHNVNLTWSAPMGDDADFTLEGYNVYRNGLRLNSSPLTETLYDDIDVVSGQYTYCVKAKYNIGESGSVCDTVDVAVALPENKTEQLSVYPNPVRNILNIESPLPILECSIYVFSGARIVHLVNPSAKIDLSGLKPGVYTLKITTQKGVSIFKTIKQ
jgi:photosystem II stability/assembly factor-like uncharacterized protein